MSRLFILIFGIFTPIYILITFFTFDFQLSWLPYDWAESNTIQIFVHWISPILFCAGWVLYFAFLGTRSANSLVLMQETSSIIPVHYLLFYGINALVILVIFLIPVFTPIITIFMFVALVFRGLTSRVDFEDLDEKTQKFVRVVAGITAIPVILCSILVIPELIGVSSRSFNAFWAVGVDPLFIIMKSLGIALSIGNFVILYRTGVKEAEHKSTEETKTERQNLFFLEGAVVAFLLFLNYYQIEFVEVLNYIGGIFVILAFIVDLVKGRTKQGALHNNPIGLILYLVFFLSTFAYGREGLDWLEYVVVIGSALIFMAVFLLIFFGHPDLEEMD